MQLTMQRKVAALVAVETIVGGDGNDTIEAVDWEVDNINCGPGNDTVNPDPAAIDAVAGNY
jgi:hypothetical protein